MRLRSLLVYMFSLLNLCITATLAISLSKPGCQEKCGNVTIPYPFGIGLECSQDSWYNIVCQNSTSPVLSSINMRVLNISLYGTVIVKQRVSPMNCTDEPKTHSLFTPLKESPFTISTHYNTLLILGCKNSVWLLVNQTSKGVCTAICDVNSTETSCNGINCCQTTIPQGTQELSYTYQSKKAGNSSSYCGYTFPVDTNWLQNDYKRYRGLVSNLSNAFDQEFVSAPLVIDWEPQDIGFGYANCRSASSDNNYDLSSFSYFRKDETADNYIYFNNDLFRFPYFSEDEYASSTRYCYCPHGFEGSPYLPEGCRDIDECSNATLNYCMSYATCINMPGYYKCVFPKSNKYRVKIALISVASAVGAVALLLGAWLAAKSISRRIYQNRRQNYFKRNGGLLLEQTQSGLQRTKVFSAQELARATDDYNGNRVVGRGGQGTVYKGMLRDGRIVAIKKSKKVDERDIQVFINEVVILSQINHRNVVKLLGCCLETEVPLLVYEFVLNGTLFRHIHDPSEGFPLTWEMRLRIAREAAGALAYLHSAASTPIYHRDIKSTNILLDDKYRAKISDFGTSKTLDIDQTHVTTRVVGTFGYLDPEYFQSSQFTEKSDVYNFGVVMVELLTGEKAVSSIRAEMGRSLATHFLHSMEGGQLLEILDARVLQEGKQEEVVAVAGIARRCLHLDGRQRPTMKEVAVELEGLKQSSASPQNHEYGRESHSSDIADSADFSSISAR